MAMATRAVELAIVSSMPIQSSCGAWQQGQALTVQPSGAACRRRPRAVLAVCGQQPRNDEAGSSVKRSLMNTAMALVGASIVLGGVAGNADAALQKVEGTQRDTQDAVTTGIRETSKLGAGKSNTVQEGAKTNSQASGGTILGVPRLDVPGGAYRSPQSGTYTTDEAGGKRSTPAGILQGESDGSGGKKPSSPAEIGGDTKE